MSVERQQPRVAFQGERGAFGEEAAVALLGPGVRVVPRRDEIAHLCLQGPRSRHILAQLTSGDVSNEATWLHE